MGGSLVRSRWCTDTISVLLQATRSRRCFKRREIAWVWIEQGGCGFAEMGIGLCFFGPVPAPSLAEVNSPPSPPLASSKAPWCVVGGDELEKLRHGGLEGELGGQSWSTTEQWRLEARERRREETREKGVQSKLSLELKQKLDFGGAVNLNC
nr:hypothetical protein CFP56_39338 [Quercus suber]